MFENSGGLEAAGGCDLIDGLSALIKLMAVEERSPSLFIFGAGFGSGTSLAKVIFS